MKAKAKTARAVSYEDYHALLVQCMDMTRTLNDLVGAIARLDLAIREHMAMTPHTKGVKK